MSRLQCSQAAAPTIIIGGCMAIFVGNGVTINRREATQRSGDVGCLRARVAEPVVAGQDGQADTRGGAAAHGEADGRRGLDLVHLACGNLRQRAAPLAVVIAGEAVALRVDEDGVAAEGLLELLKRHRLGRRPPVPARGQGGIYLAVEADVAGDVARRDGECLVVEALAKTALQTDVDVRG